MTTGVAAGPELDALVAERVLGWGWAEHFERRRPQLLPPDKFTDFTSDGLWHATDKRGETALARYSTTWEGAGLVVERMRELGWHFVCDTDPRNEAFMAGFLKGPPQQHPDGGWALRQSASFEAPTFPEAVARAALAALEER